MAEPEPVVVLTDGPSVDVTRSSGGWRWTALTAAAPTIWGTTYIVTTTALPDASPLWSSTLRALPAGALGLLVCRQLPRGEWTWKSGIVALVYIGVFFPLLFVSAYRLPGGIASVLSACQPIFTGLLAWGMIREPVSLRSVLCGVAGVVGIALMVADSQTALDLSGIAAGVMATGSMAIGIVLTKKWGRPTGGFTWTVWLLAWASLLLVPASFLLEGAPPRLDATAVAGYLWLSLAGTLVSYWIWFTGLARITAAAASFLTLLSPLVATLLGVVVAHEHLSPIQQAGFATCLVAILLAQPRQTRLETP